MSEARGHIFQKIMKFPVITKTNTGIVYLQLWLLLLILVIIIQRGSLESFMYFSLVFSYTTLPRKLLVTLSARVFDSFMYYPLVFSKIPLCSCLIIALPAREFDTFMYCPLVCSKMRLWSKLVVTLPTSVFDSFMYNPLMTYQTFLLWYLMATDIANVLFIVFKDIAVWCICKMYFHSSVIYGAWCW